MKGGARAAAFGLLLGASAHAESLQSVPEHQLIAPRVTLDPGVIYPEQALREHVIEPASVELTLVVDAAGHVSDAKLVEPKGHGFDQAALSAAQRLRFEPASRDGRPVTARIKYRYLFTPPRARMSGEVRTRIDDHPISGATVIVRDARAIEHQALTSALGQWSLENLSPGSAHVEVRAKGELPARSEELLEPAQETHVVLRLAPDSSAEAGSETVIEVKGERPPREVSRHTLSREELRHSAGTQGDALLSIQNLPGIARPPPFSGALVVRGSAPDDTPILIDGTEVPLAYHFGGLSSVVPTELVDQIDFYPGNFSSRYGRAMGGIVEARLRPPRVNRYHFVLEASLLGLRGILEGPLGNGFSFFAAGQRSWLDLVFTPLLKAQGADQTALPHWADYQLAVQKDFRGDSSLRVMFFGSDDGFDLVNPIAAASDPRSAGALGYHTSFWRLQTNFDSELRAGTHLRFVAAYGQDRYALSLGSILIDAKLHPLSSRLELTQVLARGLRANAGFDAIYQPYDFALQLPPLTRPGVPSGGPGQLPLRSSGSTSSFQPGLYTEIEWTPWLGTRLVPGLRFDYDRETAHWDASPRLNLRQDLQSEFPKTTFKAGAGLYFQPPQALDVIPVIGQSGLISNRSAHYDVGLEQEFTRQLELSLDVFYKRFSHLVVAQAGNSGMGSAYGVEWLLRYKPDAHFFGWISYTLSRSERRDVASEPSARFQFDQTHVLALVGNYKFGRGWQLGGRFRFTSGDLYTPLGTGAYDASTGTQLGVSAFPPNGSRLPAFNQLDFRLEKTRVFRNLRLTTFLDVQNVYYAKNPLSVNYNYNYTQSARVNGLPLLPILGVRGETP